MPLEAAREAALAWPAGGGVTDAAEGPENNAVRVAVRVRPIGPREPDEQVCVQVEAPGRLVAGGRGFSADFAFDGWCTQQRLYDEACAPLVARALAGYNATVIAYGQTGSGKTFTMGSAAVPGGPPGSLGVIPRAVDQLFSLLAAAPATETCRLRISYLEIYNDELKDLLHPHSVAGRGMGIREDAAGGIFVQGVREVEVSSRDDLLRFIAAGSAQRTTGATLVHTASSRSHALFTLRILRRLDAGADVITSKLRLVDLAGSERAKKTGAAGSRFRESISINRGLLALGNVIAALSASTHRHQTQRPTHHLDVTEAPAAALPAKSDAESAAAGAALLSDGSRASILSDGSRVSILSEGARPSILSEGSRLSTLSEGARTAAAAAAGRNGHVPYRASKLTRLLQDSLGGNSHTLMIACVAPTRRDLDETLNTLRYAARARAIRNAPVLNIQPVRTSQLRAELAGLQAALLRATAAGWGAEALVAGPANRFMPPALAVRVAAGGEGRAVGGEGRAVMMAAAGGGGACGGGGTHGDETRAAGGGGGEGGGVAGGGGDGGGGGCSCGCSDGDGGGGPAPHSPVPPRLPASQQTLHSLALTASSPSAPATPRQPSTASLGCPPPGMGSPPTRVGSPPPCIGSAGRTPRTPLGRLGHTLTQWGRTEVQRAQIEAKLISLYSESHPAHSGRPPAHSGTGPIYFWSGPQSPDGIAGSPLANGGKPDSAVAGEIDSSVAPAASPSPRAAAAPGELCSLYTALHRAADRSRMLHAEATQQLRALARADAHGWEAAMATAETHGNVHGRELALTRTEASGGMQGKGGALARTEVHGRVDGSEDALAADSTHPSGAIPPTNGLPAHTLQAEDLTAIRAELQATRSALRTARAQAAAAQSELEDLRADSKRDEAILELAEARADLERDEAIFVAQVGRIRELEAAVAQLTGEQQMRQAGGSALSTMVQEVAAQGTRGGADGSAKGTAAEGAVAACAETRGVLAAGAPTWTLPPVGRRDQDNTAGHAAPAGGNSARPGPALGRDAAVGCFDESSPSRPIVDVLEAWDEVLMDDPIGASHLYAVPAAAAGPPTTPRTPRDRAADAGHNASPPPRPQTSPSAAHTATPPSTSATSTSASAATPSSATPPPSRPPIASAPPRDASQTLRRKSLQVEALQNRLVALQGPPRYPPAPGAAQADSPPFPTPEARPCTPPSERPSATSAHPPARAHQPHARIHFREQDGTHPRTRPPPPDGSHPPTRHPPHDGAHPPRPHDGTCPRTCPPGFEDASTVSRRRVGSALQGGLSPPTGICVADRIQDAAGPKQKAEADDGRTGRGATPAGDAAALGTRQGAAAEAGEGAVAQGAEAVAERASVVATVVAAAGEGAAKFAEQAKESLAQRESALSAREAQFAELERVHTERMRLRLHAASPASARDSAFPPYTHCATAPATVSTASPSGFPSRAEGGDSGCAAPAGTLPRGTTPTCGILQDRTAPDAPNASAGGQGTPAAVSPLGAPAALQFPAKTAAGTPPDEAVESLGRDNFFYKHSNRELKRRLRQLGAEAEEERARREAAEAAAAAATAAAAMTDQLQIRNQELATELLNLRAFLQAHPDAAPARVSRRALRPMGEA